MATYDINSLTIQNGKLYSGGVEVLPTDTLATYNQAAPDQEGYGSWAGIQNQAPSVNTSLPVWSALQNFQSMIPDAPLRGEGSIFDTVNDPYAAARSLIPQLGSLTGYQVDPFLQFTNTGTNRNGLYGADMIAPQNTAYSSGESAIPWMDGPNGYTPYLGGLANNLAIPDLSKYIGGEFTNTNAWMQPASAQSSAEAQAILKKFFPNVSQEQLDRAAYAALQSGQRYYNGPENAPIQDDETWYYGHGPLPVVTGIAKQLGGIPPELQQFLSQNWTPYAQKYGALREQAKASASAEQKGHITSGLMGIGSVVGIPFGLSSLLNGGLGSLLGGSNIMGPAMESGAMGTTGAASAAGGSSMFDGLGDWFSNLFNGGTSPVWGSPEWMAAQDMANFGVEGVNALGNSLGYSQGLDWASPWLTDAQISGMINSSPGLLDSVTKYITQNPGSTAKTAIQALTSGVGGTGGLLGALGGGLLGSVNGSQQAGTTTTTQAPWGPQQPYLLDAFARAQQAAGGGPLQTQANANYQSVLSGPTRNPMLGLDNPYLTKAIDYANQDVTRAMMPAMNQANRASGSFGNSGVADQFGTAMTNQYGRNATNMRMQDYTNQQNLYQQDVNKTLDFTRNVSDFSAAPSRNYAQTIQGSYGGSTSSPYFDNPLSNILGGAMIGNKIGSLWG